MRLFLLAAVLLSAPWAEAQVYLGVVANTGYDFGYAAPSVGVGMEAGWTPQASGFYIGVRAAGDYILVAPSIASDDEVGGDLFGRQRSAARFGLEAIARWEAAFPVTPYIRGGLAWEERWEHIRIRVGSASNVPSVASRSGLVASSGWGLMWRNVFAEAAYGVSVRSYARNNVGGGRVAVGVTF
ncbi:MAG: hypothetical protein AAF845_11750 [Bacteroidota bacterium]